jgi:hypothetical protein
LELARPFPIGIIASQVCPYCYNTGYSSPTVQLLPKGKEMSGRTRELNRDFSSKIRFRLAFTVRRVLPDQVPEKHLVRLIDRHISF